jgi:hypothetical protein
MLIIFALGFISLPTAFLISALTVQPAIDVPTVAGGPAMQEGQASGFIQIDHANSRHRQQH